MEDSPIYLLDPRVGRVVGRNEPSEARTFGGQGGACGSDITHGFMGGVVVLVSVSGNAGRGKGRKVRLWLSVDACGTHVCVLLLLISRSYALVLLVVIAA